MFRRHPALTCLTIGYLAVVGWVTLGPQPLNSLGRGLLSRVLDLFGRHDLTAWITYGRVEFLANVLLFLPIGLLFVLMLGRRQWWLAILAGIALTLTIELLQMSRMDRVSDPRDVVANTLGALVGVGVALLVTAPASRRAPATAPAVSSR